MTGYFENIVWNGVDKRHVRIYTMGCGCCVECLCTDPEDYNYTNYIENEKINDQFIIKELKRLIKNNEANVKELNEILDHYQEKIFDDAIQNAWRKPQ